jgi:capsular exopolysaccharide synthesis family protein
LETSLIDVTVTGSSPDTALRVAQALEDVFPKTIADYESRPGKESPVLVRVSEDAQTGTAPVSPKPTRNLALGLVLGLLLGFGAALLRDEAFRSLRTNLQFIDVANPPKSIVVTSSLPGEGKSTTTANLAISLAETGLKVVVIEGDLRRPRLLDYLGFEGSVGLTDVLVGRVEVDDVLQPFGRTGLRLLGAGPNPPNPSELLGSANMEQLIEDLTERFDYVLIDAPPLLPVTDAAVLSTIVDGALVVVGAGVAQREHVRRALDSLDAVNGSVLGLILNRVKAKEGGAGYGTYEYDYRPESERQRAKGRPGRLHRAVAGDEDLGPVTPRPSTNGARSTDALGETEGYGSGPARGSFTEQPQDAQRSFPADDSIFH